MEMASMDLSSRSLRISTYVCGLPADFSEALPQHVFVHVAKRRNFDIRYVRKPVEWSLPRP